MRKSAIIKYFLIAFIVGVLARTFYSLSLNIFLVFSSIGTILGSILFTHKSKHKKIIGIFFLGGIFLFFGILRVETFLPINGENHVINFNGQVAQFNGLIIKEPDIRESAIRYQVDVDEIVGDVLVFAPTYPEFKFGDRLKIRCRLQQPEKNKGFDYVGFLAKDGIYSLCFNPQSINKIDTSVMTSASLYDDIFLLHHISIETKVRGWFIDQKQKFKSIIDKSINFPVSSFLNSILLGQRREVSQKIQDNFSQTGTSHLMAISGLHVVILSSIIFSLFQFLRIPKKRTFIFVIVFLIFFVSLIGFKASAIRASLFGLVGMLSQTAERPKRAVLVLLWVASILLLINPLLLVHDIGFQLSFLAVLGLIYLGPSFKKLFRKIPNYLGLRDILVMTMSAQIFVLPWIIYKFGSLSVISPLANLLVLPVMPIVMILGISLIILGLIWLPLTQIIGWIVWILVSYILLATKWLSQVPLASLQTSLSLWGALMLYLILAIFIYQPTRQYIFSKFSFMKKKDIILTDENTDLVVDEIDLKDYNLC